MGWWLEKSCSIRFRTKTLRVDEVEPRNGYTFFFILNNYNININSKNININVKKTLTLIITLIPIFVSYKKVRTRC